MSGKKRGSYKDMVITNNGDIVFTYSEAKELGIKSSQTFHRVKKELIEEKGFIDIADAGNWYDKKPTKYSISERWRKYGTDEYRKEEIPRILPDGIGFKKNKTRFDRTKATDFDRTKSKRQIKKTSGFDRSKSGSLS